MTKITQIPAGHFQPCGDLQLLVIYSPIVAAFQETHESLLQIPVDGEGSLTSGDVEGNQLLVGNQFHQVQRQIGVDNEQDHRVILLHHPLDVVDMIVDNLTDELSCLRMVFPQAGTEHIVSLLIVIISRATLADFKTGIEVHKLQEIVIIFIIAVNLFVSGIAPCLLDEITGQSESVIFVFHHILIKD